MRSVAEDDLVVLHCHQTWPGDPNSEWAGIDTSDPAPTRYRRRTDPHRSATADAVPEPKEESP